MLDRARDSLRFLEDVVRRNQEISKSVVESNRERAVPLEIFCKLNEGVTRFSETVASPSVSYGFISAMYLNAIIQTSCYRDQRLFQLPPSRHLPSTTLLQGLHERPTFYYARS